MKKNILSIAICCCMLMGCSGPGNEGQRMTQAIETDSSKSQSTEAQASQPSSDAAVTTAGETSLAAQTLETTSSALNGDYYTVKAEIDVIKLDLEALEAKYRIGELDGTSFETQRAALQTQKETLEAKKRELREPIPNMDDMEDLSNLDIKALLVLLEKYEGAEDQLDRDEDRLEISYLAGELTREEYIKKQTVLLSDDDILDGKKDYVEDCLERLGWDD